MIYGTRISLAVAVIAVSISLCRRRVMGLAAGYLGGWLDQVLSRLIDAMLAFPGRLAGDRGDQCARAIAAATR